MDDVEDIFRIKDRGYRGGPIKDIYDKFRQRIGLIDAKAREHGSKEQAANQRQGGETGHTD